MYRFKKILTICGFVLLLCCLVACNTTGTGNQHKHEYIDGVCSCGEKDPNYVEEEGITFVTNSVDCEIKKIVDLNKGDTVTLPKPTKEGYMFAGWYTTEDFSSNKLPSVYTYNGSVTLYANWYAMGYTITLVSNEVTLKVKEYSFKYLEEINIETPTSDQFDFIGWFDEEGNEFTETTMPARDIILTAKWQGKDITVTFDLNGGTAPSGFKQTVDLKSGETLELLNPTKAGNLFKGWYDEDGNKYTSSTSILFSTTLTAKWDSLGNYESHYEIIYELNGGTLPSGTSYQYQVGVITQLAIPTRTGFEFVGWYESEIFYGQNVTEISDMSIGDLTFYAKWREIKEDYTVSFYDHNGNLSEIKVSSGSKATRKELPTYGDAELTWYLGNQEFDFDTPINEDIILRANWKMLSDKLPLLVPSVFENNVLLNSSVTVNSKQIYTTWQSSDVYTLTNSGVTNPDRVDTIITLTGKFTFNGVYIEQKFDVIVPKVVFKDLTDGKPVFGYVYAGSYKGFTETAKNTLEVVNIAFGRVMDDATVSLDDIMKNLITINQIRKSGVRVVLSIGGADQSSLEKFSNMAASTETRGIFAESILDILETYHLDGVDIDWEYPGMWAGRPVEEDKPNYTLMMAKLNQVLKGANPDYLLTAAVPGGKYGISRYAVSQVIGYMDYLHLMTYDFHDSTRAYHHTALYGSSNTSDKSNVHDSVNLYNEAGAPLSKLVIGCAFYGRVYIFNGPLTTSNGLGSANIGSSGGHMTYTDIYNFMKNNRDAYKSIYDDVANAAAIYIPSQNKLISFDNANSIKAKCNYVWSRDLGGIMYWENGEDTTDLLLQALQTGMKK